MKNTTWTDESSTRAKRIWAEYQERHNLSNMDGQTAGIDPESGRIWLGASVREIVARRDAEGIHAPLLFERVGSDTYYLKGSRR